jgi:hypothetical protein
MADAPAPALPSFPDRHGSLLVCGILEIILGVLIALNLPLLLLSVVLTSRVPGGPQFSWQYVGYTMFLYAGLCAFFLAVGIGSVRSRRWARSLMLVVAWPWMAAGVIGFVVAVMTVPRTLRAAMSASGQPMPPGVFEVALVFTFGILTMIYLVLPLIFLLVYSSRNVRLTAEARDPQERWTDRVRPRVLGGVVVAAFTAYCCFDAGVFVPFFPLFGTLLDGWAARVAMIALAVVFALLTAGLYRRRMSAWWGAMALMVVFGISNVVTWMRVPMIRMYEVMGMSEKQLDILRASPVVNSPMMTYWMAAFIIAILAYLVWIREDFVAQPQPPTAEAPPA